MDAPQVPDPTLDELVMANCLAVQAAAEAFAAENDGQYQDEPSKAIGNLIPFLPDSKLLTNPATGALTEPVHREPTGIGSTSYYVYGVMGMEINNRIHSTGYYIVGRCEEYDIIITNAPDTAVQMHELIIENCLKVHEAAEAFAADNGGVFATNNDHVNPLGKTIQDYLPDGRMLLNPYTSVRFEPIWGSASAFAGQIGYVAVDADGNYVNDGYFIDASGPWHELIFVQTYHYE